MARFQIVSDSSCDLGRERAERLGVTLVSFYVSFDGETYYREERDITNREFYQQMADRPGVFPRTSMPTVEDYLTVFRPMVERGEAVLCVCLNAPFSGSFQAARNARSLLLEDFPHAEICVLDSQLATVLQGVLVLEAVHLRDAGVSLAAAAAQLESNRKTGRIFFTTNDLEYLKHGGRVGRAAAAAGSLLHVKPLIGYRDGGLISDGIAQGRKRSMQRVRELFCRYVEREGLDLSQYYVVTGCGLDEEEYRVFTDQLFEELEQRGWPTRYECPFHIGVDHRGPHRAHAHRGGAPSPGGLSHGVEKRIKNAAPETFWSGAASIVMSAKPATNRPACTAAAAGRPDGRERRRRTRSGEREGLLLVYWIKGRRMGRNLPNFVMKLLLVILRKRGILIPGGGWNGL